MLARYEGLRIASIETFSEHTHALSALEIAPANAQQGQRATIFAPLPVGSAEAAVIRGRDQSEDRTLGDYISRKSA